MTFDVGREPGWGDLTPHPLCQTTIAAYPDPRPCPFTPDDLCHLGHPANCRWFVDCELAYPEEQP